MVIYCIGAGAGAEIMDKGGAKKEPEPKIKKIQLRNTGLNHIAIPLSRPTQGTFWVKQSLTVEKTPADTW